MTLTDLSAGKMAVVETLIADGFLRRRLLDLGVLPGTSVMPLEQAVGGCCRVKIRGVTVTLRRDETETIRVREVEI